MKLGKTPAILGLAVAATMTASAAHACKTYVVIVNQTGSKIELLASYTQKLGKNAWLRNDKAITRGVDYAHNRVITNNMKTSRKKKTRFRIRVLYRDTLSNEKFHAYSGYAFCDRHDIHLKRTDTKTKGPVL